MRWSRSASRCRQGGACRLRCARGGRASERDRGGGDDRMALGLARARDARLRCRWPSRCHRGQSPISSSIERGEAPPQARRRTHRRAQGRQARLSRPARARARSRLTTGLTGSLVTPEVRQPGNRSAPRAWNEPSLPSPTRQPASRSRRRICRCLRLQRMPSDRAYHDAMLGSRSCWRLRGLTRWHRLDLDLKSKDSYSGDCSRLRRSRVAATH